MIVREQCECIFQSGDASSVWIDTKKDMGRSKKEERNKRGISRP